MIQHILLFKFNEKTTQDDIRKIIDKFLECKGKVAGFESILYGANISPKKHLSAGFTYGVVMTFTSQEDLDEYNRLDEHKEAQDLQKPFVSDVLVFDIES